MSTRAQLQVTDGEDKVTLYHHCDGYPDNMVHSVLDAFWNKYPATLEAYKDGRTGYVSNLLCKVDDQFQPLSYHDLHGDIEYYYVLKVTESPWEITVYATSESNSGRITKKRLFKGSILEAAVQWNRINILKRMLEREADRKAASK